MEYVEIDKKQVFGSAELDEFYMEKIKRLFDDIVMDMTREVHV